MTKTTYREAIRAGLRDALAGNQRVFLMGEDVGRYGGAFACSHGLLQEFCPERIRDTPLSESTFVGAGIGAALNGLRPIVEIMTVNFSLLALDQIVNNAATLRHMTGGQASVPLVIRMATGGGRRLAAQHSHSWEVWFAHVPGIKVLAPATVTDAKYMLGAALREPDPVVIFEHAMLYPMQGTAKLARHNLIPRSWDDRGSQRLTHRHNPRLDAHRRVCHPLGNSPRHMHGLGHIHIVASPHRYPFKLLFAMHAITHTVASLRSRRTPVPCHCVRIRDDSRRPAEPRPAVCQRRWTWAPTNERGLAPHSLEGSGGRELGCLRP